MYKYGRNSKQITEYRQWLTDNRIPRAKASYATIIYMSDYATKKDVRGIDAKIDKLDKKIDKVVTKAVEDLSGVISDFAQQVDTRFKHVDERIEQLDHAVNFKIDTLETKMNERFEKLEASIDRLTRTIDGFVKRVDDLETENTARDAQFARLLDWARKVSAKTGIPLENL